jgi:hypothetical protein
MLSPIVTPAVSQLAGGGHPGAIIPLGATASVLLLNVGLDLYRRLLVYSLAFMNCLELKVNFISFFNSFIFIGLMRLCPL